MHSQQAGPPAICHERSQASKLCLLWHVSPRMWSPSGPRACQTALFEPCLGPRDPYLSVYKVILQHGAVPFRCLEPCPDQKDASEVISRSMYIALQRRRDFEEARHEQ